MADITQTVYEVARGGLDLTASKTTVVTANNYFFPNDGRTKLYVKNATGSTCVVTIDTPNTVDGQAIANRTVSVATAKEFEIGPFPPGDYNDGNGKVKVTFDQTVDIVVVRG
ncbi:MAG: hypothetical protein IT318_24805 [Anaerolineales bacterium]|nr:hypothetical protein [Anaerolineales bacterium]